MGLIGIALPKEVITKSYIFHSLTGVHKRNTKQVNAIFTITQRSNIHKRTNEAQLQGSLFFLNCTPLHYKTAIEQLVLLKPLPVKSLPSQKRWT